MSREMMVNGIILAVVLAACAWVGPAKAGSVNWTAECQECYP